MGNKHSKTKPTKKCLLIYQQLIAMGFDETTALESVQKFGTIQQCIDYIESQKRNSESIVHVHIEAKEGSINNNSNSSNSFMETKPSNDDNISDHSHSNQTHSSKAQNNSENSIPTTNVETESKIEESAASTANDECKSVQTCQSVHRTINVLKLYIASEINDEDEYRDRITESLNDFIHIITTHNDDNSLETIRNMSDISCDSLECTAITRNERDRISEENKFMSAVNNHVLTDIMDQIHCYFLHSFDGGYRLSQKDKAMIEKLSDNKYNDINFDLTTVSFRKIREIMHQKRERFSNRPFSRKKYSKFVTSEPVNIFKESKKTDLPIYNFSTWFNYWNHEIPTVIIRKYNSLKFEILSNPICCLTLSDWSDAETKAKHFLETNYAKKLSVYSGNDVTERYLRDLYGLKEDSVASIDNLLVIILYTDFDLLSFKFSETFRPINREESIEGMIERHRNYYWFGKLLRETIEFFGDKEYNQKALLYHGISTKMVFSSTWTTFYHPTSTTKQITVAQQFATNNGIILQLLPYTDCTFFDCSWISMHSREDEMLHVGSNGFIKIWNIIECDTGAQHKEYLRIMNLLIPTVQGGYAHSRWTNGDWEAQAETRMLDMMLSQNSEDKIPPYFMKIVQTILDAQSVIVIDVANINGFCAGKDYFWSLLLCPTDKDRTFVNLGNINRIFNNVECIILNKLSWYSIKMQISPAYIDLIASVLVEHASPKLKYITIRGVGLDKCDSNSLFEGVEELLVSVRDEFQSKTGFKLKLLHGLGGLSLCMESAACRELHLSDSALYGPITHCPL